MVQPSVLQYAKPGLRRDPRQVMPIAPAMLLSLAVAGLGPLLLLGRRRLWVMLGLNGLIGGTALAAYLLEPLFVWRWDDMRFFEQRHFDPNPLTDEQYYNRAFALWWSVLGMVHLWSLYLGLTDRRRLLDSGCRQAASRNRTQRDNLDQPTAADRIKSPLGYGVTVAQQTLDLLV